MLPFWISIALLSLAQGALVALPRGLAAPRLSFLRGRRWAVVPALSVIGFVLIARGAEHASAQGLTYLALCAVPPLAALALGWLSHGARPARALLVLPLFALAWADRGGLAGDAAALTLSAFSCVTLAVLLAAVTPPRWLAAGIVAMAVADTALVVSDLLRDPNNALNAAHPAAGLPRLQSAALGSAVMGYGDLFVAALLGALLAVTAGSSFQLRGAALTAMLALCFDLLFFVVNELPATVPVAVALVALIMRRRRSAWRLGTHPPPRAGRHPPRRARIPAAR
ncbi:MAG TPA: hypothetical protein VGW98_02140 [Solirubrobacteraceae bacterium]|nr:hypothetical protein [Solirubrobacteraceae bacterium]